jgi:hypothetical protein
MTVAVYFRNGESATLAKGQQVTTEVFPTEEDESVGFAGFAVRDDRGEVIGRFQSDQIVGWIKFN